MRQIHLTLSSTFLCFMLLFSFSTHPLCIFPHLPRTAAQPLHCLIHSHSSFFVHLSLISRPRSHLSLIALSFSLSHVTCWHHSLPLSLSKSWQHRSFLPLSHDKTKGGNQMTNFSPFTWFLSLSTERKLCPPNPSSSPEVCPVLSKSILVLMEFWGLMGKCEWLWALTGPLKSPPSEYKVQPHGSNSKKMWL